MAKLTVEQIKEIVSAITYKPDWIIHLKDDGERLYVQIEATTLDSITKQPCTWKSGKTYLSPFMCRQEIVGAVFGAIEKAEIHEMREFFRYKGASIYNPHLDPDVLAEVAKKKESFNVRDNAMSMEEPSRAKLSNKLLALQSWQFKHSQTGDLAWWDAYTNKATWDRAPEQPVPYTTDQVASFLDKGVWIVVR